MSSWVAIERVVEERRGKDAAYRRMTEGKPLRSHAEDQTDEDLLAKLRMFEIEMDRPGLDELTDSALSAQEITEPLLKGIPSRFKPGGFDRDWIWISVAALWQRWFPEKPFFEALDDKIQAGQIAKRCCRPAACTIWLDAWRDVQALMEKAGTESIEEFDGRFAGTQFISNWIQDLRDGLWNAALEDQRFALERVKLCERELQRSQSDDLTAENWRRALAESYFELGENEKADAVPGWLADDPKWGWGWIGWVDLFQFTKEDRQDLRRSEELLREGLAIGGIRDRADVLDRLADVCNQQGREGGRLRSCGKRRKRRPRKLRVGKVGACRPATSRSRWYGPKRGWSGLCGAEGWEE